jgi:hypothetical protein
MDNFKGTQHESTLPLCRASRFIFCYAEFHYSECRWASYYMAVLASAARTTITRNNIDYTTPKEPRQVQLVCFGYRRGKLRQWKHYLIKFMHSNGLKVYLHVQFCDANLHRVVTLIMYWTETLQSTKGKNALQN